MSLTIRDTLSPGLKKAAAALDSAGRRQVLEAMGTQLGTITARSFNDPSARVAAWAPLKPATLKAKLKAGKSSAILKRDAMLARSWISPRMTFTNSAVTVGTDRTYAAFHQFGTRRGIPARPMLPFIGGPESAVLAPWAREKLERIARAKIASLLKA